MQTDYILTHPDVLVDDKTGNISVWALRGDGTLARDEQLFTLSQRAARDLALDLVQAIRLSQDRSQIGTKHYHDSEAILRRQESPLGQAIAALRRLF